MVRKLFIVGALAALPLGVLANSALAGPPPIDVSNAKISCTSIIGSAKLKPGLTFTGASPASIQVKGTVGGCTVSNTPGNVPVTITGGKFKGVLTSASNNCGNLLGANAVSGTITFSWKADSTTPISLKTSTLTPGTLNGSTFAPASLAPAQYGEFTIGASTLSGAFTGGDGGATVHAVLVTSQSTDVEQSLCNSTKGLSAITLGVGLLQLQ